MKKHIYTMFVLAVLLSNSMLAQSFQSPLMPILQKKYKITITDFLSLMKSKDCIATSCDTNNYGSIYLKYTNLTGISDQALKMGGEEKADSISFYFTKLTRGVVLCSATLYFRSSQANYIRKRLGVDCFKFEFTGSSSGFCTDNIRYSFDNCTIVACYDGTCNTFCIDGIDNTTE